MLDGCTPWPAEFAERYREQGYWRGETLGAVLRTAAKDFGPRTALVHGDRRISYAALDEWADRLAAGFADHGIRPDERVIVQLPNVPEFVAICFALFRLGAKPVFALAAHRHTEIRHLQELSGATAYIGPGTHRGFDYREMAKQIDFRLRFDLGADIAGIPRDFPEPDPSDVAFFLLSGGTTALPKLIPRTHDDYVYQTRTAASVCELSADDVYLATLPIEFNFAWGSPGVLGTLWNGGKVVIADSPSPDDCFPLIEREGVTVTALVPSLTQIWVEVAEWTEADLSTLRLLQVGGARMRPEFVRSIGPALGCRLQQVFGMAEGLLTFTRGEEDALRTQGTPISPADELRITDETGNDVPTGEIGELVTRGPYTLRGYYRVPEHNKKAFTADGFYRTGDLARLTGNGELVIEGRIKDMIIRGGDKISSGEVESHLAEHPAVAGVAVVGVPDEFLGERICAYVIPRETAPSLAELREFMHGRDVAEYKLPDLIKLIDAFPLTPLGKVDRKALR
ncbi:AMP-binding protein [Allokutzneria sp. A3M-2-11 16]|uniref:(2,3-dihydroxybenzoyl)adenylate synthase n=1 Tax=Allokutzneria sp. A3M-2-11 16 TaxID=2962043 RepID=UPI0020B87FE5|nr:AMP-binding protein [Allokutzneria sp. A3M-2-11 16]MCP3801301.1 AMP-binding protein [Allokutzneria sp. A3M-2-11 16]